MMKKLLIIITTLTSLPLLANHAYSAQNNNSKTAFEIIREGRGNLCEYLEGNIVGKTVRNRRGETMYFSAIRHKNVIALSCLDSIGYGVKTAEEANSKDSRLILSPYEYSIRYGNVNIKSKLKSLGGVAKTPNYSSRLMFALKGHNNEDIIEALIRSGDDVNYRDILGRRPIHYAAKHNTQDTVELLIRAGADINATDIVWNTPLMFAAINYKSQGVVELLIRAGANVNYTNNLQLTALMYAVTNRPDSVPALIQANADINVVDINGWSPLHFHVYYSEKPDVNLLRYMIDNGATKTLPTSNDHEGVKKGSTPYDIAVMKNKGKEVLQILKP